MATDRRNRSADRQRRSAHADVVERYRRPARWFHAGIYATVLILVVTGWWLLAGQEGQPSPLARLTGMPDTSQHKLVGWILAGLAVLVVTGAGLAVVHGGPAFVVLAMIHKWTTYPVTALIAGHVLIASGALPGYRGVWRSMHLGGRLDARVAGRLWPAWSRNFPGRRPARPGEKRQRPPT